MILITHKGERLLVESTAGYPGCKVVARNVPHPPHDHCCWKDGAWAEDCEAKAKGDETARLSAMSRGELIEEMLRRAKSAGGVKR